MPVSDAPLSGKQLSGKQLSGKQLSGTQLSGVERFAEHADGHHLSQRPANGETADLLALVSALRTLDFDVRPSELTRIRQRQRLVAMAAVRPSPVARPADAGRHRAQRSTAHAPQIGGSAGPSAWLRRLTPRRRLVTGLVGFSVLVAALGVLALFAQNAIPGDTLYALKRGTEQARLVLAGSEQEEGRVLLSLASTRMEEIVQLLDQPSGMSVAGSGMQAADADGAVIAGLLIATLETMDLQTTGGTSALTTTAVDHADLPTLQFIGQWGVDQFTTLDRMSGRMPEDARPRADESMDLLQRVVQRLEILAESISCECSKAASSDDLGPLPCATCTESEGSGSPSAATPTSGSGSASTPSSPGAPTTPAVPPDTSTRETDPTVAPAPEPAPGPVPGPRPSPSPSPSPNPLPIPIPIPIPIPPIPIPPIPIPGPPEPPGPGDPPDPVPPPESGPNEGDPCVLIGFLGIEIPGIIIGGVCVGLGG